MEEESIEPKAGSWKPGVEGISKRSRSALPNDGVGGAEHHTGWLVQHGRPGQGRCQCRGWVESLTAEGFTKKEVELKATAGTDFYLGDFVAKKVMGEASVGSGNGALCAVSFLEMGEASISVC